VILVVVDYCQGLFERPHGAKLACQGNDFLPAVLVGHVMSANCRDWHSTSAQINLSSIGRLLAFVLNAYSFACAATKEGRLGCFCRWAAVGDFGYGPSPSWVPGGLLDSAGSAGLVALQPVDATA